jgi:hypothetical protein
LIYSGISGRFRSEQASGFSGTDKFRNRKAGGSYAEETYHVYGWMFCTSEERTVGRKNKYFVQRKTDNPFFTDANHVPVFAGSAFLVSNNALWRFYGRGYLGI